MRFSPRQFGTVILLSCGVLTACSGTPSNDEPLPTLAQLPTVTPVINVLPTATISAEISSTPTLLEPKTTAPADDTSTTPNPIVLPGPLDPTATATSVDDLGLDVFPEILEVGTQVTLQGTLSTTDVNSGVAILTNKQGQIVNLLVDPFTAMTSNDQEVQITGTVEKQSGIPANAIRVSEINMINGASALATATDLPVPGAPTDTP